MLYRKVCCPWCGNEITVKAEVGGRQNLQKCQWCRRYVGAAIVKERGKIRFEVEDREISVKLLKEPYKDRFTMSMEGMD